MSREDQKAAQEVARELYIGSATLENDFTPDTEEAIAKKMKFMGYSTGSSSINRWKRAGKWKEQVETIAAAAIATEPKITAIVKNSSLETAIENTKVDIKRNDNLIAGAYQIAERETLRLINEINEFGKLRTKEDIELFKFIFSATTARQDKMLDRIAQMPREAITSDEVLSRLANITLDIEGEIIEGEIQKEETDELQTDGGEEDY